MKDHLLSRRILILQMASGVLLGLVFVLFVVYQFNPSLRVLLMAITFTALAVTVTLHFEIRRLRRKLKTWLKTAVPTDSILEGFQLLALQSSDAFEPFANDLAFRLVREPQALNGTSADDILVVLSTIKGREGGPALALSVAVMGAVREWLKSNSNHLEYARVRSAYEKERRRIEKAGLAEAYA